MDTKMKNSNYTFTAIFSLLIFVIVIINSHNVCAQDEMSDVTIKTTHVGGNVYMLEGRGGNIGVSVGDDGILMIDDQFAPLADRIKTALSELNKGKLRFVLNTHFHGDHIGGNHIFSQDATIIAHENVRNRLSSEQIMWGEKKPPLQKESWPVITFDKSLSIHFNGEEIKVLHYPNAHTDGDAVIFFTESNVVHMGDLLFNKLFPYVDLDHGGDVVSLTAQIATIIESLPDNVRLIPGHGELANKNDLIEYHKMLSETTASIAGHISDSLSLDQIKEQQLPKYESWSWGFIPTERWIETVYNSLTKK